MTVPNIEGIVRLTAEANFADNTITIDLAQLQSGRVEQGNHADREANEQPTVPTGVVIRVMLNDDLLNLDRDVRVICNGRVMHDGPVARSAIDMIQTLLERGDTSFIFPAVVTLQFP